MDGTSLHRRRIVRIWLGAASAIAVLLLAVSCSSDIQSLRPQSDAEVYVLPDSLPSDYVYVSAEPPSADTHPTFAGLVLARRGAHTLRITIRWPTRPGDTGAIEDSAAAPLLSEVAGQDVYLSRNDRTARVAMTEETDVWLTFDRVVGDLPPEFFESLVGSLTIVSETKWLSLVESLVESE